MSKIQILVALSVYALASARSTPSLNLRGLISNSSPQKTLTDHFNNIFHRTLWVDRTGENDDEEDDDERLNENEDEENYTDSLDEDESGEDDDEWLDSLDEDEDEDEDEKDDDEWLDSLDGDEDEEGDALDDLFLEDDEFEAS